jgi:hypothetical protein
MNIPIPKKMDGIVLTPWIDEDFLRSNAISFSESTDDTFERNKDDIRYSKKDECLIKKRLQSMGYM